MKVNRLPFGAILWKRNEILGIKGITLSEEFYDAECCRVGHNELDYELIEENK